MVIRPSLQISLHAINSQIGKNRQLSGCFQLPQSLEFINPSQCCKGRSIIKSMPVSQFCHSTWLRSLAFFLRPNIMSSLYTMLFELALYICHYTHTLVLSVQHFYIFLMLQYKCHRCFDKLTSKIHQPRTKPNAKLLYSITNYKTCPLYLFLITLTIQIYSCIPHSSIVNRV